MRQRTFQIILGPVLSAALATSAIATDDTARRPKGPFAGDLVVQRPDRQPFRIKIYYGKDHIRMDMPLARQQLVTIVDRIRRETVLLLPHRQEFMRIPSSRRSRAAVDHLIEVRGGLKAIRQEKVGGIVATKYALTTKTATGATFEGHVWLTADNIMILTVGQTPKGPVKIALHNLRRGPVDPALFVVPSGYVEKVR
ncbi:MAG: hypothetical protein OXC93_15565 [Rhodospirillaceae bacterium]|nr:hypothetical protein [Rhodospirillaceae bacterium]